MPRSPSFELPQPVAPASAVAALLCSSAAALRGQLVFFPAELGSSIRRWCAAAGGSDRAVQPAREFACYLSSPLGDVYLLSSSLAACRWAVYSPLLLFTPVLLVLVVLPLLCCLSKCQQCTFHGVGRSAVK